MHHGLARAEAGADGGHALHAVDQFGHHRAEALADGRQLDLAFTHAAIQDRGDQRILIELEVGEDLGDFQARCESSTVPSAHRFFAALACCSASRANSQASFKASRSSARSTLTA